MSSDQNQNDIRKLLLENNRLLKENNVILVRMQRSARIARIFRIIWLLILIVVPLLIYYFVLAPLIDSLESIPYTNGRLFDVPIDELQMFLENFSQ